MPIATTNNSLSKIFNPNDQSFKPPTFKNVGDCSPNPLRIDAPVPSDSDDRAVVVVVVMNAQL